MTFAEGTYEGTTWSPGGRYVIFGSRGAGMLWTRADGASQPQPLVQSTTRQIPMSFAPDGKRLAYKELNSSGAYQIWTVKVEDDGGQLRAGKPEQFLKTSFSDIYPRSTRPQPF